MADDFDIANARDLFGTVDLDGSGYIDREELAAVCDLDSEDLGEVFNQLDADRDGRISIEEFSENFKKFKNVVSGIKQKRLSRSATGDDYDELKQRLGKSFSLLSGHEYVTELFHHIHNAGDSPQLLSLLESFLFSVIRDIKNYESENQKLEEALKRTCEKHAEHMENLDEELEQQLSRVENRIKKEEKSKYERSSMDIIWQMENKNKEIQALQAKVQKLEARMKRKEPEEQKLKEEIDERVQEIRYLRSQVTDAQTNMAVLKSELVQLRNDYEDQTLQLENEKHTVMECVQEQESLTRQLQLLHEANKKLHDTNDDLRSALESRRASETGRSPSPSKRSSITTLYTPAPKPYKRSKSNINSRSPSVMNDGDLDRLTTSLGTTPLRSPMTSTTNSRRGSLLPIQQSCEVDEPGLNEDSLLNELIGVNHRRTNFPDGTEEEDEAYGTLPSSERESMRLNLNILAETNKRLCESNDDLRAALEAVSKRASKPRSREKCKRNTSFHSDYGSISSRSITPNQLQKSENDVADGAEDLSGYEPESDGNNTSTLTLQGRHDELPDRISKTLATPRERIKIAGRETNDVIWESDHETETADQEQLKRHKNADETSKGSDSPFARNSLLRKPLRHKSIESLKSEMESKNSAVGKGDRSTWPALARKGKWNSLEQVRKKNEFAGARSNSLPASRCQSSESLDFETGVGLSELSDKLNALKSSQENILSDKVGESKDTCHEPDSKTPNHLMPTKNNEINEPALGDPLEESKQVVRKELDSPSKSTNTQKIELVSSAVQVDMNSDRGRRTPLLQDGKTINQRPDSLNEQGKDKRKKKHSPREEKDNASKESSKEGVKDALKGGSKRSSKEAKGKDLSEKKGSKEGQRDGLKKASRDSSKEGLMEDSKQDSKQDSKERSKQGLETPIKSKESFSRSSNRGESPFRSPSTRPFSQTSNDNSSVPQDYLPNNSPYASPRSTIGYKKDSTNKGRSEILSLIAGERPGQDLAMVQHLRSEVEGNENPLLKSVVGEKTNPIQNYHTDLNRSITNDIFAPLNKSCPIFSTRKHFSDGAHRHDVEDGEDLNSSRGKWTQLRKMNPYNGALVHRVRQTESIADSDLSKVELLSAELEAQFKSVKEEDEEDIDEDDVDDEELAQLVAMATGLSDTEEETESDLDSPDGLRPTTLGTADISEASTNTPYSQSVSQDIVPERMFKLVLAGDAAVGKSSFILRLCRNRFHNALNSTLGVDFQMKTLVVDGKNIALQLWDTAGQERFRSIAKSYFRKADGVLLLYDVTCETSFLDVRDWVEAIEESCTKPVPIMLCGNKTDLRQGYIAEGKSVISTESGQKIAKEYGALFTETSAKDNRNITEACEKLARMLQDVEDLELNRNKDKGMQLSETDAKEKKKSSCCPR